MFGFADKDEKPFSPGSLSRLLNRYSYDLYARKDDQENDTPFMR